MVAGQQLVPSPAVGAVGSQQAQSYAFYQFVGADWLMNVALLDPTTGQKLVVPAGTTFIGLLYLRGSSTPAIILSLDNGGVAGFDPVAVVISFVGPRAITANAVATKAPLRPAWSGFTSPGEPAFPWGHAPAQQPSPPDLDTRLVVFAVSPTGTQAPVGVFGIFVDNLRTIDPSYFQDAQTAQAFASITTVNSANIVLHKVQLKRAMEADQAGTIDAMFTSGLFQNDEADPGFMTWRDEPFAPPGGAFETLVLQFYELAAPKGRGLNPAGAAAKIAALRTAAAVL